jgi:hypothetical protein
MNRAHGGRPAPRARSIATMAVPRERPLPPRSQTDQRDRLLAHDEADEVMELVAALERDDVQNVYSNLS